MYLVITKLLCNLVTCDSPSANLSNQIIMLKQGEGKADLAEWVFHLFPVSLRNVLCHNDRAEMYVVKIIYNCVPPCK